VRASSKFARAPIQIARGQGPASGMVTRMGGDPPLLSKLKLRGSGRAPFAPDYSPPRARTGDAQFLLHDAVILRHASTKR
jgi:hypothetical protein